MDSEAATVAVDGEKLRRLRKEKGWQTADLARRAGCVLKTIQNAENGKRIKLSTLSILAQALKVSPADLMISNVSTSQSSSNFRVQIVIEGDLNELNRSDRLINFIELVSQMLGTKAEISSPGVMSGSAILLLDMPEEDARRLMLLMPDFHELARDAIRNKTITFISSFPDLYEATVASLRQEGDKAELELNENTITARFALHIFRLLEIVDSVRELRIPAGGDADPDAVEIEPAKVSRQHDASFLTISDPEAFRDFLENMVSPLSDGSAPAQAEAESNLEENPPKGEYKE